MNVKANLVIQYQHHKVLDFASIESGLLKGMEKVLKEIESASQKIT
jgi:hypothetical protein